MPEVDGLTPTQMRVRMRICWGRVFCPCCNLFSSFHASDHPGCCAGDVIVNATYHMLLVHAAAIMNFDRRCASSMPTEPIYIHVNHHMHTTSICKRGVPICNFLGQIPVCLWGVPECKPGLPMCIRGCVF